MTITITTTEAAVIAREIGDSPRMSPLAGVLPDAVVWVVVDVAVVDVADDAVVELADRTVTRTVSYAELPPRSLTTNVKL